MPPRKRAPTSSSSSSSSKALKKTALNPQASKFGIQHFFDRHSHSQAVAVSAQLSSPIQNDSSNRALLPPLPIPPPPSFSDVNGDDEKFLPVSPEITKMASAKRVKFSPGMIIKQSQDDGGDEITWKISPVNERLKSFTGKVLAGAGKLSVLGVCSKEKKCSDSVARFEKWATSSTSPVSKTSMGSHHKDTMSVSTTDEQSPFRTPPSALYAPGESGGAISFKRLSANVDQHQNKKALLELLDQVEDAITVEDSTSNILKHCSVKTQKTGNESNTNDNFFQENSSEAIRHSFPTSKSCSLGSQNVYKENGATEKSQKDNLSICHSHITQKFLVLEVSEKHGDISMSQKPFKVLRLFNELCGHERNLHLCDEWFYSLTRPGDTINVIGEFDKDGKCIVDRSNNLFILHPDILVSGSRVSSSFSCLRRAVLDERLKSTEQSISALIGTMLHQIFQAGLLKDSPTRMFLEEYAASVLQKNVENLYACDVNESDMFTALIEMIPRMLNWISHYKEKSSGKPSVNFRQEGEKIINITEVVDIEEVAWAPRYGIKGMIDASLRVKMGSNNGDLTEIVVPLEFKTGKATTGHSAMEHQAQVILYTLLMSERYLKNDIDSGLLYYLHTDKTIGIKAERSDLVGIIMRRNDLATSLLDASTTQALPSMLQSPVICRSCRHLQICTVYHKAHGGNTASSGLDSVFDFHVKHLTAAHFEFLLHWDRLIDLEAKTSLVTRKELLCPNNSRRGQNRSSIRSIILDDKSDFPVYQNGRFNYKFVCKDFSLDVNKDVDGNPVSTDLVCSLKCGDYVILSTESGRIAIANGTIAGISASYVTLSLSRRLRLPGCNPSLEKSDLNQEIWRIDKDEFASSYAVMRFNLSQLFLQRSENTHLRKLIVDLEAPRFDSGCIYSQDPAISYVRSEKSLNDDQCRAIQKMLTAKDYALILGMPGTGKTSTLVHAVKAFLIRGASILLTSYTNSAVDNLLLKLKAQNIDFIRIGRQEAVHDDIHGHCISACKKYSVDEIKQKMSNAHVVGVTCLGINHSLLTNKKFDICIMDEAGQTTLPVSLGPLMFASVFILVGDHYQLPPLVQSAEALDNGMGKSLFCKLSEAHPSAISALQCQYRMCAGIMDLSNALIYGNRLCCGSSEIANAQLNLSFVNPIVPWLQEILDPKKPVIFINTDSLAAFETRHDKIVNNPTEAYIVSKVTRELLDRGVLAKEIGIITPYNSQADLIQRVFGSEVEIHTVDRYQGRDKDCIILSFVRSNEFSRINASSLLGDWQRINVALTRAKKKLIMVGSCKTLSKVPLLNLLIEKVTENGHIFNLSGEDIHLPMELKKCSSMIQKLNF